MSSGEPVSAGPLVSGLVSGVPRASGAVPTACLEAEIAWFQEVLELRMRIHAGEEEPRCPLASSPPPPVGADGDPASPYAAVVRDLELDPAARLVLVLAFLPHVQPEALDPFFIRNRSLDRTFTEFGGVRGMSHGGFLPTGETAMFLLAGGGLEARLRHHSLFSTDHPLFTSGLLHLDHRHDDEPRLSSALQVTPEWVERLTTGGRYRPPFSARFPAQRITTRYGWDDLVLDRGTLEDVGDVVTWVRREGELMDGWRLRKRLKPGYRSLFYGPPGTGKTLTATLLGKTTGLDVYRIDLSKVVSKYIGETEKNLARVFDHAEHGEWILFFDEADSLFGKRTESRTANDRAANQQIAYLLQRIEDFPGVVLLATNLRAHLDEAFGRRFQSIVHFPMPDAALRLRLWRDNFEGQVFGLAQDVDLEALARQHELSGGSIVNVLRYACLKAVERENREVRAVDLLTGIRRELHKQGKFLASSG